MKKTGVLALLCLGMAAPSFAQSTFPTSGSSAGIGTTSPTSVSGYGNLTLNGSNGGYVDFFSGTVKRAALTGDGSGLSLYSYNNQSIRLVTNSQEQFTLTKDGNLGIGQITPRAKLEVGPTTTGGPAGIFRLTGGQAWGHVMTLATDNATFDDPRLLFAYRAGAKRWALGGYSNTTRFSLWEDSGDGVYGTGWGTERFTVLPGGNVGIGTSNPANALDVNGTIHSKAVKVDMNGWSDYVFDKTYNLRTLESVKQYIDRHGHLPDVPSAETVIREGVSLGDMNNLLLKKVEELTLYLINERSEKATLRKQLAKQEARLRALEAKSKR